MTDVARVAVETPLPHLDRLFDFAIPEELDAPAQPGCRVRVRFHGRRVGGWLIARGPGEFEGALQPLQRVSGPPVLTDEIAGLSRLVADRYAGTLTDVLRFAVPSRVAAVEKQEPPSRPEPPPAPDMTDWAAYGMPGEGAASWICHPHDDPFAMLAAAAVDVAARGRGAVLVVPDARDVRALHAACLKLAAPDAVAVVSAEASARLRYKTHLEVLAGARPIVIGTRSAVFAPVPDLGLIAVWDDGDDVLVEPQTPGWHAREVAALRAWQSGCRLIVGGYTRTAATAQWVADGTAHAAQLDREHSRARRYRVEALVEPAADRRRIPGARVRARAVRGRRPAWRWCRCRAPVGRPACSAPSAGTSRDVPGAVAASARIEAVSRDAGSATSRSGRAGIAAARSSSAWVRAPGAARRSWPRPSPTSRWCAAMPRPG